MKRVAMIAMFVVALFLGIICEALRQPGGCLTPWQEHLIYTLRRATGAKYDDAYEALVWANWSVERAASRLRR